MSASIRVVSNNFPLIANKLPQNVSDVINNGINNVIKQADPNTPVKTGALKANKSILYASAGKPQGFIYWNQEYAIYVHEGTYKMAARPFAQDAVDAIAPGYMAEMQMVVG